ncbi:MAG: histidine kinase dimerization/phosphoacceptor domain-containing protein [Ilumatobacteraceae bacterium]
MHDIVGHSLTVVLLNIAGARRHLATNPAAAAEAMERAESISRDSLETVRSVVGLLSSSGDSQRDAPLPGGGDVLPLLEQAKRCGLPVSVALSGNPSGPRTCRWADGGPATAGSLGERVAPRSGRAHRHPSSDRARRRHSDRLERDSDSNCA